MTRAESRTESNPIVLHFRSVLEHLSDEDFFKFCQLNRDLRIERTKEGDLIIMPPTGSETGAQNFSLTVQFGIWVRDDATGLGFDSSAGFTLPNGAVRSPDLAWVKHERWNALSNEEKRVFAPICPDFVVELPSPSDSLTDLHAKMADYVESGAQLGWLIDPLERRVYIYKPHCDVECLDRPGTISGEPLLSGFVLDLRTLWD
jgi:Uma2 family endonuclease